MTLRVCHKEQMYNIYPETKQVFRPFYSLKSVCKKKTFKKCIPILNVVQEINDYVKIRIHIMMICP